MGVIYTIKRGSATVVQGKLNGQQSRAVMVEDRVMLNFTLPSAVTFKLGDTITVYGQGYKINRLPNDHERNTEFGVQYDLEFEALFYDLGKWKLRGLGPTNALDQVQVDLRGDARSIIDLAVRNANRNSSGWTVGVVDVTDVDTYSYNSTSILAVLQDVAARNNTEFWVQGKVINLSRRQISSGLTLGFGMGKGLYTMSREKTDHVPINRLNVYGGLQNIPYDYGFERLQLPLANRPYLSIPPAAGEDVQEDDLFLENIFPTRQGAITAVNGLVLTDSTIDFNINDYHVNGNPVIAFVSGQLASFSFEIENYNHATKSMTIKPITDDKAYGEVPNVQLKPAVGDKYVLLNLNLPQAYITAKENELLAAGQKYFNDAIQTKYNYRVNLTPIWVKQQSPVVELGNTVVLKSTERGIDKVVRISGYTRDLQEDYIYPQFTLSDLIEVSQYARELQSQREVQQFIKSSGSDVKDAETLQTVTRRGATSDRIITVKGTRNQELLIVPSIPSTEPYSVWIGDGVSATVPPSGGSWGNITGNITDQTDLITYIANNSGKTYTGQNGINVAGTVISPKYGVAANTIAEGNHAHSFAEITGKPSTIAGYGITNAYSKVESDARFGRLGFDNVWDEVNRFTKTLAIPLIASAIAGAIWIGDGVSAVVPPSGAEWGNITGNVADQTDLVAYIATHGGKTYTAGANVQINGTVISATDTKYTAGSGLSLSGTVFTNTAPNIVQTTITGNAGSASKLLTARTIWGQSFDGTGNVSGSLSSVVDITGSGILTMPTAVFATRLTIPSVTSSVANSIWIGDGVSASVPSGNAVWGAITGNITAQTDLVNYVATYGGKTYTGVTGIAINASNQIYPNYGTGANTVAMGNDSRINNGQTAFGWGDHASVGYWKLNYIISGGASSADANTVHPNGGFTFSYSTTSWLTNSAFNEYGGLITYKGTGNRGALQFQYGVGHSGESGSRIAFRTEYGTSGGNWRSWKELWHSGNLRSDAQNDATYTLKNADIQTISYGATNHPYRITLSQNGGIIDPSYLRLESPSNVDSYPFSQSYMMPWKDVFATSVGVRLLRASTSSVSYGFDFGMTFNTRKLSYRELDQAGWGTRKTIATEEWVDSLYFLKSGGIISGNTDINGVLNVAGSYARFAFLSNVWYKDNLGNDCMYIGSANNANGVLFRASQVGHQFQIRDVNSSISVWINMTSGTAYFKGSIESAVRVTAPEIISTTRLRIPTSMPASPQPGDIWIA